MPDFDLPGLGKARMKLTEMSRNPTNSSVASDMLKENLIKELYTEIRAARIAGHSWASIRMAILSDVNMRISRDCISETFAKLDKTYEEETGVKALPRNRNGGSKKGFARKSKKQEASQ